MSLTRREWLAGTAAGLTSSRAALAVAARAADDEPLPIVDTHQHLWELPRQRLAWLGSAAPVLRRSYTPDDYRAATAGLNVVRAVYMEVDVEADQHEDEAAAIVRLCRSSRTPTRAAVVGGRPASPQFGAWVERLKRDREIKGVRQVLHGGSTPRGYCLSPEFVAGVRKLGEAGLCFDLCLRAGELDDAVKLVASCPETRFVLDHCGNADPAAFKKPASGSRPSRSAEEWRRGLGKLAEQKQVVCKISGIVARAEPNDGPNELAPIVVACLEAFGPDRVMFGGDWPVCLLGRSYRGWVEILRAIVADRPLSERRKLWHDNAAAFYGLER